MVWGTKWQGLYYRNPKIFEFNQNSSSLFLSNGANLLEYSVSAGAIISTHSVESEITGFIQTSVDQALISTLEGELLLWNLKKAQKIKSWKLCTAIYAIVANPSDPNIIYLSVRTQNNTFSIVKHAVDSNTSKEMHLSSTPCTTLFSDLSGNFVISKKGKTLYVWDTVNFRLQRYQHSYKITRLSVHPTEPIVATGDSHGHIYYWSLSTNIKSEDLITEFRNVSHWHAHTVHSLTFTKDGAYLLSGGEEGVLVICNTESYKSTYLPRLGSTLCELTVSQDAKYYAVLLEENAVLLINSATLRIEHRIQKLRTPYGDNKSCIKIDPTTNLVTLNTSSYIQFYNYIQDEFISEVEIASYLKVRGPSALSESIVDNYQFTSDGNWLCSIEHKKQFPNTSCMKFWKLKNGSKWQLHTRVEEPHKDKILTLIGHPTIPLFVTISIDKTFKVWSQLDITDANTNTNSKTSVYSWYCRSIGTYKSMAPSSATISKDGSLLAVAYNNIVTLWNLTNMMLLKEFPLIGNNDIITNMDFIFKSPYLAISTSSKLYMWNLLNFTVQWSFNAQISHLSADTTSNKIVIVVTNKQSNYLLLFTTESCKPVCYWKFNETVLSVTFINEKSLQSLHSAATNGILVLVNSLTKPLLLFEEYDAIIPALDASAHQNKLEENEFLDELPTRGGASSNDNVVSKPSKIDVESTSINKNIYHLFDAPTHILPPIPSIYKSFMDILLSRSDNNALEQPISKTSNSLVTNIMSDMEVEPQEPMNYKGASSDELSSMSQFFTSLQVVEPPKTKNTTPKKSTPVKGNKKQ